MSWGRHLIAMLVHYQIAEFCGGERQGVPGMSPMARRLLGKGLFELPGFLTEDLNW